MHPEVPLPGTKRNRTNAPRPYVQLGDHVGLRYVVLPASGGRLDPFVLHLLSVTRALPNDIRERAVIFGSTAAYLRGAITRVPQDLDLFVSAADLATLGAVKNEAGIPRHPLADHVDVFETFPGVDHAPVLAHSEVLPTSGGLHVGALVDVVWWKLRQERKVAEPKGVAKREADLSDLVAMTKRTAEVVHLAVEPPVLTTWIATCPRGCPSRVLLAAPLASGDAFLRVVGAPNPVLPHPRFGNFECIASSACSCGRSGLYVYRRLWM